MRSKLVVALAALVAAVFSSTASATGFSNLQPGVPSADLRERVPVNVVFVGFGPDEVGKSEFRGGLPARVPADRPLSPLVRRRPGARDRLPVRLLDHVHELVVGEELLQGARAAGRPRRPHRVPDGLQRAGRHARRRAEPLHRRAQRREVAHRQRPEGRRHRAATRSSSSTGGAGRTSSTTSTRSSASPTPTPATTSASRTRAGRSSAGAARRPTTRRPGWAGAACNRVWFFDLSAGPEAWGGNFDITNEDLDGDGEPDYRIPVAWEYADDGYRSPGALTGDLGLVARYAAINLMFASSPLYPPYLTPELLPTKINLDMNTYEGWPGVDASARLPEARPAPAGRERALPVELVSGRAGPEVQGKAKTCYELWLADTETCYRDRPQYPPFANLFLYNALNLDGVLDHEPARGKRIYEAPAFNYATTDDLAAAVPRLRRRQLDRRDAELRLQLRLPERRRHRVRADDDGDPRVRPPLRDEPSARRLRLGDGSRLRAHGPVLLRLGDG